MLSTVLPFCMRLATWSLLALCCAQVADIANQVSAELLRPERRIPPAPRETGAGATPARTWSEREPILDRNLFGAQLAGVVEEPPPEPERIEKTELRLELLATIASPNRDMRMASVWNKDERDYQVLRAGDALDHLPNVTLARVERRRVILQNGDDLEELRLEDRKRVVAKPVVRKRNDRTHRFHQALKRRRRSR